jgi:dihydrofolate reductase
MRKVVADISMSLDGFITGPNVSIKNPMGDGGEQLHDWMFNGNKNNKLPSGAYPKEKIDTDIHIEKFQSAGAIIIGKVMFDLGEIPWGDNPPFHMPVFIVTHQYREKLIKDGGTTYIFVTDGIESTLKKAKAAAGDKNVGVWGGANIDQQFINSGLLDEIQIHLVPIFLGDGIRLFDHIDKQIQFKQKRVTEALGVAHIKLEL